MNKPLPQTTERVDDIPLLLTQLERMGVQSLLDEHFPTHGNWQRLILERFDRKVKKDGILSVLKKGIAIDDAHLTLLYSLPYNDANPRILENFEQNIFSVTRQVHYSDTDPGLSVDMVLFLSGIALATMELKNLWTGQTVYHAKQQ